jgi:hypothetical protein
MTCSGATDSDADVVVDVVVIVDVEEFARGW